MNRLIAPGMALTLILGGAASGLAQTSTPYTVAQQTRSCINSLPLADTSANRTLKTQCVALATSLVAMLAPPPPPVEVCGDGIDNDGDGLIDEGCAVTPPPVEVCGDGIDNDKDGQIDEGCSSPPPPSGDGIWISQMELQLLPTSGAAWTRLLTASKASCGTPNLEDQDDNVNVCIMAKALVAARLNDVALKDQVTAALSSIANDATYDGRALSLGRELAAYVLSADLIQLSTHNPAVDSKFRVRIKALTTTSTTGGPSNLIDCHEKRPNNWGSHCGASRAAVAAYLGDKAQLDRIAVVFKGFLGDRASYAGFSWGDTAWQCDPAKPVGINPLGCQRSGHSIDGVLPDDQRRTELGFVWPPPKENYVYESLQGALAEAVILKRAGYDVFEWQDRALLRAFTWLNVEAKFPPDADDAWQTYLVNHYYGSTFAVIASKPGKNVGWTDWTHSK